MTNTPRNICATCGKGMHIIPTVRGWTYACLKCPESPPQVIQTNSTGEKQP